MDDIKKEFSEHLNSKKEKIDDEIAKDVILHNSIINRSFLQAILDAQAEILSELKKENLAVIQHRLAKKQFDYSTQILDRLLNID